MMSNQVATADGHAPTVRRLAAIDIALLGPRFILVEYFLGVFGCGALGLYVIYRAVADGAPALEPLLIGGYFLALAINYAPLLVYSITIVRHGDARAEMVYEIAHKDVFMARYRRYSLLLLVPLLVAALALWQERTRRR